MAHVDIKLQVVGAEAVTGAIALGGSVRRFLRSKRADADVRKLRAALDEYRRIVRKHPPTVRAQ